MGNSANQFSADDRLDIIDLLARYWQTVDSGDTEGFANTFTVDGPLENYTGITKGRAALAPWLDAYGPNRAGNRHYSVNPRIMKVDDNTATVWSYMVVLAVTEPRKNTPHVAAYAAFHDRIVRVDGQWLFEHRLMDDLTLNKQDYPDPTKE